MCQRTSPTAGSRCWQGDAAPERRGHSICRQPDLDIGAVITARQLVDPCRVRLINFKRATLASIIRRLSLEPGQTMAEYAILLGVIALVVVVVATLLGSSISALFSSTAHRL
jgi:Flp pilus assembly pilin Flp